MDSEDSKNEFNWDTDKILDDWGDYFCKALINVKQRPDVFDIVWSNSLYSLGKTCFNDYTKKSKETHMVTAWLTHEVEI